MRVQLTLQQKLILSITGIVLLAVGLSTFLAGHAELQTQEKQYRDNLLNTAHLIASSTIVQRGLADQDTRSVQSYVEQLLPDLTNVEIITIADQNGIRFGHPNRERLGEQFVGGDETAVIRGKVYTSVATGTLGTSLRAFVPVYYKNKQVGFVMTGHLYDAVRIQQQVAIVNFIVFAAAGIAIGSFVAIWLSISIRKQLHGLEPAEIGRLYGEKNAMLASMKDGLIAVGRDGRITLFNEAAKSILHMDGSLEGRHIKEVIPTTRTLEVLETGEPLYGIEMKVRGAHIVSRVVPIVENGSVTGVLASFNDRTEVVRVAEELTGVRQIVDALRANTHEFMNKLHVIHGLAEMNQFDQLKSFIRDLRDSHTQLQQIVLKDIANPTISGLLLGKFNRGKELGVKIALMEGSELSDAYASMHVEQLVTIIGNLLENAMEAVHQYGQPAQMVRIGIFENRKELMIQVEDNGQGIPLEDQERIFQRGFSTKETSNGIGLFLVSNTVTGMNGQIDVLSHPNEGTVFTITLPKEESE